MGPMTQDVTKSIVERLCTGNYQEGAKLPTEMEMARAVGSSRMVVNGVMRRLESRGVVRRNKRGGTVLLRPLSDRDVSAVMEREKTVLVVASHEESRKTVYHWNEATLLEIERGLRENRRRMISKELPPKPTRQDLEALLRTAEANEAEALLFFPTGAEMELYLQEADLLMASGRRVCVFDRGTHPPSALPFNVVSLDPFKDGVLVGKWLCQNGYRNLVIPELIDRKKSYWVDERIKGVMAGLRAGGHPIAPDIWRVHSKEVEDIAPGVAKVVAKLAKARPGLVLISLNNTQAAWIIDAARKKGLRVPEDFSVVSFDNNPAYRSYNLTTVAPPVDRVGKVMVELACSNPLSVDANDIVQVRLASTLIERNTCIRPPLVTVGKDGSAPTREPARSGPGPLSRMATRTSIAFSSPIPGP